MKKLDRRPEITEVLDAAQRYPNSQIYLTAYVTETDTRARHADAIHVADELVIELARYLATRGIDASRISGKGMGINRSIGRAIIVSLDVTSRTESMLEPNPRQIVEREAAGLVPERQPSGNRSFKEVGGIASYRVGPGDALKILYRITGAPEFTALVSPLGTITFDLVEDVPVAGLSTLEIESLLKSMLRRYYRNPRPSVVVINYASRSVTVITPAGGKLVPLTGRTTVFDLVVALGLPTGAAGPGVADLKGIRVRRGIKEFQVNAFEIVQNNDWKENLVLDEGDIVYLPTFVEIGDYVTVLGAVGRPGIYPMSAKLTAAQAVFAAGPEFDTAYLPHARIIRGDPKHPEIIPADLDLVINQGITSANKQLQSGDILYVPRTRITDWNKFIADIRPSIDIATLPLRAYYEVGLVRNLP